MFEKKNYLSVKETAEALGYIAPYVNKLIRDGKLKALKRGRRYFITPAEIDRFVGQVGPTELEELV